MNNNDGIYEYAWLNTYIMSTALRGYIDGTGPITVNWKQIENILFVLVQEYTGKWYHRLFICMDDFHFELNKILYPSDDTPDLVYVYDFVYDIYGTERKILKLEEGNWLNYLREVVFGP